MKKELPKMATRKLPKEVKGLKIPLPFKRGKSKGGCDFFVHSLDEKFWEAYKPLAEDERKEWLNSHYAWFGRCKGERGIVLYTMPPKSETEAEVKPKVKVETEAEPKVKVETEAEILAQLLRVVQGLEARLSALEK